VLFAEHKAIRLLSNYQTIKLLDHSTTLRVVFVCLFLLCFNFEAAVDTQAITGLCFLVTVFAFHNFCLIIKANDCFDEIVQTTKHEACGECEE
jgi:hypothetical protein